MRDSDIFEITVARHPLSEYNLERRIQGQRDVPAVAGYEPFLYDQVRAQLTLVEPIDEVRGLQPIDEILTSDAKRANEPAHMTVSFLRSNYAPEVQKGHEVRYSETPLLRERAQGNLEGAWYQEVDGSIHIQLEDGKSVHYNNKNTNYIILPPGKAVNDFLYGLNNSKIGENPANMEDRISEFQDKHLAEYEESGGHLMIFSHSAWINHFRNKLIDGNVSSRHFDPLENLEVIRLVKEGSGPYRQISAKYVPAPSGLLLPTG